MSKTRKKKSPKRLLALPDLEHAQSAVLNTLTSVSGKRTYGYAIDDIVWWLRRPGTEPLSTHNTADYCILHQSWIHLERKHSSIIVAPQQRYSVGEELRRIMRLISQRTAEQMVCRLEFVSSWT